MKTSKSAWVILRVDDEVLLLKRGKKSNNPNLWNFPGGGVEKNETIKTSAVREVWEEAGIRIRESDLVFLRRIEKEKKIWYFYEVVFNKKPIVKINKESAKYKWLKWGKFPRNLHKPTKAYYYNNEKNIEKASTNTLSTIVNKVLSFIK